MNLRSLTACLGSVAFAVSGVASEPRLYLSSAEDLRVFEIEPDSGALSLQQTLDLGGRGPFTFSNDGSLCYLVARDKEGQALVTLKRDAGGGVSEIERHPVPMYAGYLMVDGSGDFVAGNHYREGLVSLWRLEEGIYRGAPGFELELEPKAHSAVFSTDSRWLMVPATGPNKVFVNAFDAEAGTLVPNDPAFGAGPDQEGEAQHPRHLVFHPILPNRAYTTQEGGEPGVCVWDWDGDAGTLQPIDNQVTRPAGFDGRMSTADLHFTPDGRFLYVSNRSPLDPETGKPNSSIVGFRVDPDDGGLDLIDHTPCETVPRSFCVEPKGRFLYVAGQQDHHLGAYRIDPEKGTLTAVASYPVGEGPIWVEAR